MKFVLFYLSEVIQNIHHLQKESGGLTDIMGLFDRLKGLWQKVAQGELDYSVKKQVERLPAPDARALQATFKQCGQALVEKVDSILTKTVKPSAIKAAGCLVSMCASALQSDKMVPSATVKETIPILKPHIAEWEKYITLPAQVPASTTISFLLEFWQMGKKNSWVLGRKLL